MNKLYRQDHIILNIKRDEKSQPSAKALVSPDDLIFVYSKYVEMVTMITEGERIGLTERLDIGFLCDFEFEIGAGKK